MSLVLAILSFFSAVFLPGAILYKLCYRKFGFSMHVSSLILASFIFSLCFNFYLIYMLNLFGIYTQSVVVGIFIVEILLFLYLFFPEIKYGIPLPLAIKSNNNFLKFLFLLGVLVSLYVFNNVLKMDIFHAWDAVVSWNRWGTEWAMGKIVLNEGGYSQLYPMLLSLGYVASQKISSFQGIGVGIYFYFAFVGVTTSIFLFSKDSIKGSILGLIIGVLSYVVFFRLTIEFFVGLVDMPVAMVILISALCLLKTSLMEVDKDNKNMLIFYLILGAFAAGISTEIKQSGLFWCVIYIIGLLYLKKLHPKKINFKMIWVCIAIIMIFSMPWITIALYKKIYMNIDATNVGYVMNDIFLGKGYLERLLDAFSSYKNITILFILSLFSLKLPNKIFGFFGIFGFLYFIFWGTHLSYDLRNAQAALPLMIISLSALIVHYAGFVNPILAFLYKRIALIFVCFIALGLVVASFSTENILKSEYRKKMLLGDKDANEMIWETFRNRGTKIILTNNQLLAFTPDFDTKYFKNYHFGPHIKDGEFEKYAEDLKKEQGSFYVLLPNSEFKRYEKFLSNKVKIGATKSYTLFEY